MTYVVTNWTAKFSMSFNSLDAEDIEAIEAYQAFIENCPSFEDREGYALDPDGWPRDRYDNPVDSTDLTEFDADYIDDADNRYIETSRGMVGCFYDAYNDEMEVVIIDDEDEEEDDDE